MTADFADFVHVISGAARNLYGAGGGSAHPSAYPSVLAVLTFAPPTGPLALMFSGALLAHTGACSGDVSFLQFLWSQRRHRVFTFDDINRQLTYFYRAKAPVA